MRNSLRRHLRPDMVHILNSPPIHSRAILNSPATHSNLPIRNSRHIHNLPPLRPCRSPANILPAHAPPKPSA